MHPTLLLVAHGTRHETGLAEIAQIAGTVRLRLPEPAVHVAYVDVVGPSLSDSLHELPAPVVVVPLFLATGYHVCHDIPDGVSGRSDVFVTPPLGPDPALTGALRERVEQVARPSEQIVLAAAGSSGERALRQVEMVAGWLAGELGSPVELAYLSAAEPRLPDVVGPDTVVVPYLLAPGFFQRRAASAGARAAAGALGAHPAVIDVIVERYRVQRLCARL